MWLEYLSLQTFPNHLTSLCAAGFNQYRSEHVQAGTGGHYCQREGLSQTHQDLGAVWGVHEDPQCYEEVSLTDGDYCNLAINLPMEN